MKLTITGTKAVLAARPTPALLSVLPALEGRRTWLSGDRGLSFEPTGRNLEILQNALHDLEIIRTDQTVAPAEFEVRPPFVMKPAPTSSEFTRIIDEKQAPIYKKMDEAGNVFALFAEQGTGKTRMWINRAAKLWCEQQIDAVFVLSKKGAHRQWAGTALEDHCPVPWSANWWPMGKREEWAKEGMIWFSMNWDALKTKAGLAAAEAFCKRFRGRLLIIADESQEIKNAQSERFKAAYGLRPLSSHRGLATGTPLAKDLTDEWAQLKWLDEDILGIKYLTTFRNEFCVMGGFEGRSVVAHKNMKEFRRKVDPVSARITRADLGLLPPLFERWEFDLTTEQKRLMRKLKDEYFADLKSGLIIRAEQAAKKVQKLQQIANGFIRSDDGKVHLIVTWDKNPRVQAALDWIDTSEGKFILWCRYTVDIELLKFALDKMKITNATYYGPNTDSERDDAVASFRSPEGIRGLIANPQAAGTGLDGLQDNCSRDLFYSNATKAIDRWQAEARLDRIGSKGAVTHTDLIAVGSPDAKLLQRMKQKQGLAEMAIGDISAIMEDV